MDITAVLVAIIVGLAYAVQSTFGFGAGLISLPFLTMLIGAKASISMNLIFQTLTATLLFVEWKNVSFKKLPFFLFCVAMGIVLGTMFLKNIDDKTLEIILGVYLVFYSCKQLLKQRLPKTPVTRGFKQSPVYAALCGLSGGLVSGAFGTGGPMLVSFLKSLHLLKDGLRATILFVMFYCNTLRIFMTWQTGQFDDVSLTYAATSLPLFALGIWGGTRIAKKLNDKQFLIAINVIILFAGVILLVKHFIS